MGSNEQNQSLLTVADAESVIRSMRDWVQTGATPPDSAIPPPLAEFASMVGVLQLRSTPARVAAIVDALLAPCRSPENGIQSEILAGLRASLHQTFWLYAIGECEMLECARGVVAFMDAADLLAGYAPVPNRPGLRLGFQCESLQHVLDDTALLNADVRGELHDALFGVYGAMTTAIELHRFKVNSNDGDPLLPVELLHVEHVRTLILHQDLTRDGGALRHDLQRLLETIDLLPDCPWMRVGTPQHALLVARKEQSVSDSMLRHYLRLEGLAGEPPEGAQSDDYDER